LWIFLSTSRSPHRRCGQQTHTSDYMTSVLYSSRRISVIALRNSSRHHFTLQDKAYMCRSRSAIPSASPTTVRVPGRSPSTSIYLFQVSSTDDDSKIKGFFLALFHTFHYHKPAGLSSGSMDSGSLEFLETPHNLFPFQQCFHRRGQFDFIEEIWLLRYQGTLFIHYYGILRPFYMQAAPSIPRTFPLIHSPSWLARKHTTRATSIGRPTRCRGLHVAAY
jgi:hypothetical protein